MAEDTTQEIGPDQLDALLVYLPVFEREGYQFGEWSAQEGHVLHFRYSPEVYDFVRTLYEQGIIYVFDWTSWKEEAERYQADPRTLEDANLLTLRKLLTTYVRADRFNEGYLGSVLKSGHVADILHRLRQIRDEM